jgi:hypothetical protein
MAKTSNARFESPEEWRHFQAYLKNQNRYVLSFKWQQFINAIIATSAKRGFLLEKNTPMARARIGCLEYGSPALKNGVHEALHVTHSFGAQHAVVRPLPYEEMIGPPRKKAVEGRLNPSGIPYLYLANNKETAIAEVRPWVGAYVSVAYFELLKDQLLIDLTKDFRNRASRAKGQPSTQTLERAIWSQINQSFSEPVSPDDRVSQYVHTQYMTEVFKAQGFDGVRYKSSLAEGGYNYLLFNTDVLTCLDGVVYKVESLHFKSKRAGLTYKTVDESRELSAGRQRRNSFGRYAEFAYNRAKQ